MDHHNYAHLNPPLPPYPEMMVENHNKMAGGAMYINSGEVNSQVGLVPGRCYSLPPPRCAVGVPEQHPPPYLQDHYNNVLLSEDGHMPVDQLYSGGAMPPNGLQMPEIGYPAPPAAGMFVPSVGNAVLPNPQAHALWNSNDRIYTEMPVIDNETHQLLRAEPVRPSAATTAEALERKRRERRRELNRVAATRCRERKLQRICLLQERVVALRGDTERLAHTALSLRRQVRASRQRLAAHIRAGCPISLPPSELPTSALDSPASAEETNCAVEQWAMNDDSGVF